MQAVVTNHTFSENLQLSQGVSQSESVEAIIEQNIPGSLNVYKAHEVNDKNGTDYWVELESGQFLSIDVKIRQVDWAKRGEDDLALETWSVIESNVVGWTRDSKKRTDYILWYWMDTGRWCLVPFRMLCAVFRQNWQRWTEIYKTRRQKTCWANGKAYHSECVFVPRRFVWKAIYQVYS